MNLFFKNKSQYKILFLQIKEELINIFYMNKLIEKSWMNEK